MKPFTSACAPALFASRRSEHRHAAHAEHERGELLRLANSAGAQALERRDHHLLHQVRRGVPVAQVSQPVQANARCKPPVELGLGFGIALRAAARDRRRELGVLGRRGDGGALHFGSITCDPFPEGV
jgi:hypothetical protein